ncbi:hypothetical protein DFJ74DRAFT_767844 [Hyaloraphidium curvatum]|nr:hypothetical protein DFJ74DRAFT_767844 [Hyaloraphidium curvatum]
MSGVLSSKRYFELDEKFWEIAFDEDESETIVRFGKIGSKGQTRIKDHGSPEEAMEFVERMVQEKLDEGYEEEGDEEDAPPHKPSPPKRTRGAAKPPAEEPAPKRTRGGPADTKAPAIMPPGPPQAVGALVQLLQDPPPYGAKAVFMPTPKFNEETCQNVYLDHMLGKKHYEQFGGRESYLQEWKELFLGAPPEDADSVAWLQKVKGSELEFEQLFVNADNAEDVKKAVAAALDGDARDTWDQWAIYKTGNDDVEHGVLFAASLKSGGILFVSFFSD